MNILVLNGSPKGLKSNTFKLTNAFLKGINANMENHTEVININEADIKHCSGCFSCWSKTPGICIFKDDMPEFMQKYINSTLIIWSFPLYFFGMPSKIKAFLDRLLPLSLPVIKADNEKSSHPPRYDLSRQKHILISTCGFHSVENNFDALFRQFEIMFNKKLTKIICPEGELLRVPELSKRVNEYLFYVKKAGEEYILYENISKDTQIHLDKLLYPPNVFLKLVNSYWEAECSNNLSQPDNTDAKENSHIFLEYMAALYNPALYTEDIVLEMHFTDLDKTYQLLLGKENCIVKRDNFSACTTRIEIPFALWLKISEGKADPAEAVLKKQYKILGDFDTFLKMDNFFSYQDTENYP
jgi:multimeric flavodoxin WrbA